MDFTIRLSVKENMIDPVVSPELLAAKLEQLLERHMVERVFWIHDGEYEVQQVNVLQEASK